MNSVEVPRETKVFEQRSIISTTMDKIWAFHESPDALKKLAMPPIIPQIHRRELRSLTDGVMDFTLWIGFIPLRWVAQHEAGSTPHSFVDVMVSGPMAYWRHEHIFEQVDGGVQLIDRIEFAHKAGLAGVFSRLMFDGLPLRIFFIYRHWVTRLSV